MAGLFSGISHTTTCFCDVSITQPSSVQSSRWDEAIFLVTPGTSCLATIMLSLRDKIHSTAEALLKSALMGEEGCSSFAASCGCQRGPRWRPGYGPGDRSPNNPRSQRESGSRPPLEIEGGVRGHTGETPMLLSADCHAACACLLVEGAGETDRSPTVHVVRHSTKSLGHTLRSGLKSVLEMSKLQGPKGQDNSAQGLPHKR